MLPAEQNSIHNLIPPLTGHTAELNSTVLPRGSPHLVVRTLKWDIKSRGDAWWRPRTVVNQRKLWWNINKNLIRASTSNPLLYQSSSYVIPVLLRHLLIPEFVGGYATVTRRLWARVRINISRSLLSSTVWPIRNVGKWKMFPAHTHTHTKFKGPYCRLAIHFRGSTIYRKDDLQPSGQFIPQSVTCNLFRPRSQKRCSVQKVGNCMFATEFV